MHISTDGRSIVTAALMGNAHCASFQYGDCVWMGSMKMNSTGWVLEILMENTSTIASSFGSAERQVPSPYFCEISLNKMKTRAHMRASKIRFVETDREAL
jgi:hypothetical protein